MCFSRYRLSDRGAADLVTGKNGRHPPVEFVPVPPLRPLRPRNGQQPRSDHDSTAERISNMRGGAGLEIDLADPRHREPLPSDLRQALPDRGLVNYREAKTVVRVLEGFTTEPRPQGGVKGGEDAGHSHSRATESLARVAVLTLYPAQAELIRRLVQQSTVLQAARMPVDIGVPSAFRQNEYHSIVLSLTRSHTHRAVCYGESPSLLVLALTRACERLILVGDAGTLARRSQWHGRLDHLDEATADKELDLIAQLVRYLDGQGHYPDVFHLREGSSS